MKMQRLANWLELRLPIGAYWQRHFCQYRVPKNLNFWYFFGAVALLVLLIELLTGVFLAVHYKPYIGLNAAGVPLAFASMENLVQNVSFGWLLRKAHALGATALFAVIYLHLFRSLLYGSYRKPRELTWLFGVILLLLCLATAFFGRLLPWTQDGYWGATAILNLLSTIPGIGGDLGTWLRGGATVGEATLGRFFVLHVIVLPLLLLVFLLLHIIAVRSVGSGNPDGIELDQRAIQRDCLPYHPYFTIRDLMAVIVFLLVFIVLVFFVPDQIFHLLGVAKLTPADALSTPEHFHPAWYFAPYFAMMRTVTWSSLGIDARLWGGLLMVSSLFVFAFLPWLDRSLVSSMRYRGTASRVLLAIFVFVFLLLTIMGCLPSTPKVEIVVRFCTAYYFLYLLSMPVWSRLERCRLPPERLVMK